MPDALIGTFFWLLGLCVGSFLNVVIYRLPLDLSLTNPGRSFCPSCKGGIAFYDNIPVLSWLLLRGRCRRCRAVIAVQYPLVEALTGLLFVLVFHLLCVMGARTGSAALAWPLPTAHVAAWLVLISVSVVCSATDLASYMIDTRVTNFAVAAGIILYPLYPDYAFLRGPSVGAWGAASVAAFTLALYAIWRGNRGAQGPELPDHPAAEPSSRQAHPARASTVTVGGLAGVAGSIALAAWMIVTANTGDLRPPQLINVPVILGLALLFVTIVLVGGQQRQADEDLHDAIEEEGAAARGVALRELLYLSPMIVGALAAGLAVIYVPAVRDIWRTLSEFSIGSTFVPFSGAIFAIHGAMVGAAAGWVLRIVFTLAFGREAFGVGDIYILAAAGACGGWDIALLGLLLSVALAMAGWLLSLLLKSSVVIPFGPWLALGFVAALWLNRPAAMIASDYADTIAAAWKHRPDMLLTTAGLLLIASVAAVFFARLVRRWIEPASR